MSGKKYYERQTSTEDYVAESCETCKFNFGDFCAAGDSLYGYGGTITDIKAVCDQWMISLHAFIEEMDRCESTGIPKQPKPLK